MSHKEDTFAIDEEELSTEESEILEMMLKGELADEFKPGSIPKRKFHSPVPLSFSQQRLWVLDRLVPGNPFYNLPTAVELTGEIDIAVFERSLNEVVGRHESLRTVFKMENEEPVQVIFPQLKIKIDTIDLRDLSSAQQEAETARLVSEEAGKPFDLERGPLLRVKLLRLSNHKHVLAYTIHHIISDTWSIDLFNKELFLVNAAFLSGETPSLPELSIQYADFAVWQREKLQGDMMEKHLAYWRELLGGEIPILEMPTDYQRPAVPTYQGHIQYFEIAEHPVEKIIQLNHSEKCSMFMTLLAAFNVLLYRYSGQDDIVVGSPISNRNRAELENIIGFFVNTLVLRSDLSGNPTFRQLLARIRKVTSSAYDNQDIPFEKLVEEFQPDRYMSHTPLFQVMFVLQNVPRQELGPSSTKVDLKVANMGVHTGTSKFDIWLSLNQYEKYLGGVIEYNTDIFDDSTITRFIKHFRILLTGIAVNPDRHINDLPLLLPEEKEQLLKDWNNTGREYSIRCIHHMFQEQAEKTPEQIALVGVHQTHENHEKNHNRYYMSHMSYKKLNQKSRQLAHVLKEKGVGPDTIVGVMAERSLEMVIGLLGILEAGGAYLPLDPEYPEDRIQYMLKDSRVGVLVTTPKLQVKVKAEVEEGSGHPQGLPLQMINIEKDIFNFSESTSSTLASTSTSRWAATAANLAYVIYTSGSTGKPKGVMIPHAGICNRLLWMQEAFCLTSEDRVLQKTPFTFDVSVWEFFLPLLNGAGLVVALPGGHKDTAYLVDTVIKEKITTMHFVPSMLNVFLEEPGVLLVRSLKRVICSGEPLPVEYQERFYNLFDKQTGVELHNLYGPTEASVDVTSWVCDRGLNRKVIPIGRPIANTRIYILDRNLNLVPTGVPGELHIGGIQLAWGYLNQPELTAKKFLVRVTGALTHGDRCRLKTQFSFNKSFCGGPGGSFFKKRPLVAEGKKIYKTGDLARWLPDGVIEFLGRLDFQVKVRGFRIELGEIESILREHEALQDVVVLAREGASGAAGKKLAAYIVPHHQYRQTSQTQTDNPLLVKISQELLSGLRDFLKARLPEYMVPSYFIPLERLPLTSSGKLDRKALPWDEPGLLVGQQESQITVPRTSTEAFFAQIWKDVLLIEDLGITDNFFQLGGDSINAIQVIARANKKGLNLSVRNLYQNMTIAELASYVDKHPAGPTLTPVTTVGEMVLPVDKQEVMRNLPPGTEIEDIYPVTPFQKHMLHYYLENCNKSADGSGLFVNQVIYRMPMTSSDIAIIKDVFQEMTDVYPYLRTAFLWENIAEPVQIVYKNVKVQFEYIDWGHLPAQERDQRELDFLEADHYQGFEREKPYVYRMTVLKFAEDDYLLVQTSDLMRVDGWSAMIVYNKFKEYIRSLHTGQKMEFKATQDYKEYLTWLSRQDDTKGEEFWKQMIDGCILPTPLLEHVPQNRNEQREAKGFTYRDAAFNLEKTVEIEEFLKQYQVALSALGCAVWALILSHYSSQQSVIFGVLLSGRGNALAMVENMIGQSMNVLPARIDVSYEKPVLQWFNDIWEHLLTINDYESNQIDKIREWWDIPPEIPLFESYLVIENFPGIDKRRSAEMFNLDKSELGLGFEYIAHMEYPLRVELQPGVILGFAMQYYRNCFTDDSIQTMLDYFHCLVDEILKNPHQTTGKLMELLSK